MYPRSDEKIFIFDSLHARQPKTSRKTHIRLLYDVLQLAIQRRDYACAHKAWSILIRCKEVDWKTLWRTGMLLVEQASNEVPLDSRKLEYLSTMMLQYPEARQAIFQELLLQYTLSGQNSKALDELELYLPSQPYESNPILHIYAGLISLYLAQPSLDSPSDWDPSKLRDAQLYLEKAKLLDPDNIVASAWLEQLPTFNNQYSSVTSDTLQSDGEDTAKQLSEVPKAKRTKT